MKTLKIAENLSLPLDAATRRLAILAMSGAGKSNTAVVLAEAMFDAGLPWVAIDPKGDWWGVRSSKTGKGPGLPIPILGGLHGDIPLEPTAGKVIAELIIGQRLTCVLDVSEFPDRQGMWLFLKDLGETLLRLNRQALHLFLEEADEYLPQNARDKGNLPACLGVWQRVVKRGRFRGLGTTQITQRSASLNKDTLYQAEALIAMRAAGAGDRKAIAGWVEHHNAGDEVVASLSTLADGEGWVSSPAWLRKTVRVQFDRRRTFDSGSTPVQLEGHAKPATLADVNLSDLQIKMQATIEKAKADDPRELRRQLAEKDKRIRELENKSQASKVEEILTDADRALLADLATRVDSLADRLTVGRERFSAVAFTSLFASRLQESLKVFESEAGDEINRLRAEFVRLIDGKRIGKIRDKVSPAAATRPTTTVSVKFAPGDQVRSGLRELDLNRVAPAVVTGDVAEDGRLVNARGVLKPHVRKLLTVLAQYEKAFDRSALLRLTGYTRSGDISTAFGGLIERGLIVDGSGGFRITPAGLALLGPFERLPEGPELRTYLLGRESTHGRKLLAVWFDAYPDALERKEAIGRAGYKPSGDISTAIGKFISVGWLVETPEGLKASDDFFGNRL